MIVLRWVVLVLSLALAFQSPDAAGQARSSFANPAEYDNFQAALKTQGVLLPFLLEGVAAVDSLNQGDGIHPNAAGSRRLAETVWRALVPLLRDAG